MTFTGAAGIAVPCVNLTVFSNASATCFVPDWPVAETANVTLTSSRPGDVSYGAFDFLANPVPIINSVLPARGTVVGGTAVTLIGRNFVGLRSLSIGSATLSPSAYTVTSDSTITLTTPFALFPGPANIVIVGWYFETGTALGGYTYTVDATPVSTGGCFD